MEAVEKVGIHYGIELEDGAQLTDMTIRMSTLDVLVHSASPRNRHLP